MSQQPNEQQAAAPASFEESLARLEQIVRALEDGELSLSESLAQYEQGVKLLAQCHAFLEQAERKIELLTGVDEQGRPITEPFADPAGASLEEKAQARSRRRSAPGD
ncbi:MAG: exodeoxyribonuclease VII small subunit [Pirellulales bacterium]|jgi:exodeoxyribonuclease VII small subunit|nr:exodeoxyribonuclease VII small subunit [Pirellulales bacterium]